MPNKTVSQPGHHIWAAFMAVVLAMSFSAIPETASADDGSTTIAARALNWVQIPDTPVYIVQIWGDPSGDNHAYMIKLPAGFSPGPHFHTGDYDAVNLTGVWTHTFADGKTHVLEPGSYVMQPGGAIHNDRCAGPEDCILYVHQHSPFDFIPTGAADQ